MGILKIRSISIVFLLVMVLSVFASSDSLLVSGDSRSSIAWGVECQMEESEIQASSNVCAAIEALFDYIDYDFVEDFYGEETYYQDVYDYAHYCNNNFDFAIVFYKGHGAYNLGSPVPHFWLYDNEENAIVDSFIGEKTYDGVHDFAFLWACGMANWQGVIMLGEPVGMSASWLYRDDLEEDTHDYPDYSGHCFISFANASLWFVDDTGYEDYTFEDFVIGFYEYVTDSYTIDEALDQAAYDCFGVNFQSTWLYTGYWYNCTLPPPMGGLWWSYIREFGDGSMMLTT